MAEQPKTPETAPKTAVLTQKDGVVEIKVPKEYSSMNNGINVVVENGQVTIRIASVIAEEIGAYRRCQVVVKFPENGPVSVVPNIPAV